MSITFPKRFYIYALVHPNTNQYFYVGKGTKGRAWHHLQPCIYRKTKTPLYYKIRKMLDTEGVEPVIVIVQDDLTEKAALAGEAALIHSVGTRFTPANDGSIGTGPLLNLVTMENGEWSLSPVTIILKTEKAARTWRWREPKEGRYKGVFYYGGKVRAIISTGTGKQIHLGYFDTEEEAASS
jgi:hypothetical protein